MPFVHETFDLVVEVFVLEAHIVLYILVFYVQFEPFPKLSILCPQFVEFFFLLVHFDGQNENFFLESADFQIFVRNFFTQAEHILGVKRVFLLQDA